MIGRDGKVRGAASNHAQNGSEHASHRGHLAAVLVARGRQGVVVPEQFVRAVDQMDLQGATPSSTYRIGGVRFRAGFPTNAPFVCDRPRCARIAAGSVVKFTPLRRDKWITIPDAIS